MRYWFMALVMCMCVILSACKNVKVADNESDIASAETAILENVDVEKYLHETLSTNNDDIAPGTVIGQNIVVKTKEVGAPIKDAEETPVYIVGVHQQVDADYYDAYMVIALSDDVIVYDMCTSSLNEELYLGDVDADGADEIIVHQHLDDFGGAGTYLSRIFKVENGEICEIFNSYTSLPVDAEDGIFDTGFASEFLEKKQLKIANEKLDYQIIIDISEKYLDEFFDSNGRGPSYMHSACDSFLAFTPTDVDADGIMEIVGIQYLFLFNHASGLGYVKSILKYDPATDCFAVVAAEYLEEYQ